jgi:polyadenylate-binding protein
VNVGARRSFSCGPGDELPAEIPERVLSDQSGEHSTGKLDQSSTGPAFDYKNLLVNYLPPDMDSTALGGLFLPFGNIMSSKVVVDHASGLSKGYGFVKFKSEEDGIKAQEALNKFIIGRKTLKVSFSRLLQSGEKTKHNTNLYISNLDRRMDRDTLERHFKTCGYVVQCKVLKDAKGISKQIAFVRYDKAESAQRAIDRFNGQLLEGTNRPIKIRIAGTPRLPSRRNAFGGHTFKSSASPTRSLPRVNSTSSACYVTGFHVSLSENVLRNVFEPVGRRKVKSIRIIRRQKSPYAFVNFFNSEDAAEAACTFNNYGLGYCTLTVRLQT